MVVFMKSLDPVVAHTGTPASRRPGRRCGEMALKGPSPPVGGQFAVKCVRGGLVDVTLCSEDATLS